jgi:hypothetical protein
MPSKYLSHPSVSSVSTQLLQSQAQELSGLDFRRETSHLNVKAKPDPRFVFQFDRMWVRLRSGPTRLDVQFEAPTVLNRIELRVGEEDRWEFWDVHL